MAVCWTPVWAVLLVTKLCQGLFLATPTIQLLVVMVDEAGWLFFSSGGELSGSERLRWAETTSDAGEGRAETAVLSNVGMIQEWIPFDKWQVSIAFCFCVTLSMGTCCFQRKIYIAAMKNFCGANAFHA